MQLMERNVIGVRPEVGELNSQQIGQLLSLRLEITAKAINHTVILFLPLWLLWGPSLAFIAFPGDLGSHVSACALSSSSQHALCIPFVFFAMIGPFTVTVVTL